MSRSKLLIVGIISSFVLAAALYVEPSISKGEGTAPKPRHEVKIVQVNTTPGLVKPVDVLTLSTTVHNSSVRADGLVLELTVKAPSGKTVQQMKQRNVGVDQSDEMAVYWVWRIPQRLDEGTYSVQMTVFEPDGVSVLDQSQKTEAFAVRKADREMAYY